MYPLLIGCAKDTSATLEDTDKSFYKICEIGKASLVDEEDTLKELFEDKR